MLGETQTHSVWAQRRENQFKLTYHVLIVYFFLNFDVFCSIAPCRDTLEMTELNFAANIYRPWVGYLGTKVVERASEVPWKRRVVVFGNLSTLFLAQKNDTHSLWNLLATYELWSGNVFSTQDMRFKEGGPGVTIAKAWDQ